MLFDLFNAPKKLKELRKEKKVTLRMLSEKTGLGSTRLCRIENGERFPERQELVMISDALGLNKDEKEELLFKFGYIEFGG